MNTKNGAHAPTGSACLEKLIRHLKKVKVTGPRKWQACCPAHDDKHPSLSITETFSGVVLLRCWSGCTAKEIVETIGMELRDLFPGQHQPRRGPSQAAIEHERMIYRIGNALSQQGRLTGDDLGRFELAKQRLGVA